MYASPLSIGFAEARACDRALESRCAARTYLVFDTISGRCRRIRSAIPPYRMPPTPLFRIDIRTARMRSSLSHTTSGHRPAVPCNRGFVAMFRRQPGDNFTSCWASRAEHRLPNCSEFPRLPEAAMPATRDDALRRLKPATVVTPPWGGMTLWHYPIDNDAM